jgi:RNA polymerase sigma-70 factor (ECF subfamily)
MPVPTPFDFRLLSGHFPRIKIALGCCNIAGPFRIVFGMSGVGTGKSEDGGRRIFATTRWSVVVSARDRAGAGSDEALETLCRMYWQPIYALTRCLGHSPEDSKDLTQEFFARFLEKDYLSAVDADRGRFRTFLRVVLKRFLANERERASARKRGGGKVHIPLDTTNAESEFQGEVGGGTPDHIFDRRWALTLLAQAEARLDEEYSRTGRTAELELLKPYLTMGNPALSYAEMAAGLRCSEGAARVAVHRLRKRFREIFRETIADTVGDPQELEDECRYVMEILARG